MFHAALLVFCCAILQPGLSSGGFEMPFGCEGAAVNDQTRQETLNLINKIRSSVALGEFQAQNRLPSANNMDKLRWDCNLERMAQGFVNNCPQLRPLAGAANGMNYFVFGPNPPASTVVAPIQSAVQKWSEITNVVWPNDNRFNGNQAIRDFANMIRASTNAVGCSTTTCGNRASVACVFSQPNVQFRTLVYTSGNPCQNDGECTRLVPGFCESGLCVNAVRQPATTTAVVPTTIRRRSTDCPNTSFSSAFRETALGLHNNFRSLVARGLARNGEYANENAPPSSRMDVLEYDCNAEQYALNHVRSCDRKVLPVSSRPGYEENIHILERTATDDLGALQNALLTWNNELAGNGIPSNMVLTPQVLQRQQKSVARVTKVIWGTNRYVGCATQLCSGFYFTSCMYREPVNVIGQSIYTIGAVCGACSAGPNNCNGNIGLCSW